MANKVYEQLQDQVASGKMTEAQAQAAWNKYLNGSGSTSGYSPMYFNTPAMGYASATNVTPASAYQNPYQLSALGNMMDAYANMYGSDNQLAGTLGAANAAANASMYSSDNNKEVGLTQAEKALQQVREQMAAQKYATDASKALGLDTNKTQYNIADVTTLRNLLGIKDTNQSNQNIASTQVGPKYAQLDLLSQLLGGNGSGGLGAIGGTLGGNQSGGTAVDLSGTNNTTGTSAPPMPAFRTFDDIALQKKMGAANADISQNYDTQQKQMTNSLAGRGFSTHSPGFQSLIANSNAQKLGAMQDSNRDLQNTSMQYNAQNALPYAQLGQTQYNADQDRAMRLKLAQMANSNGLLTGLLSV